MTNGRAATRLRSTMLASAALLAVVCCLRGPAATGAQGGPVGRWTTFANGDDVLVLARQGSVVWSGSRAGGLVRWNVQSGAYVQYLRPQTPLGGNTVFDIGIDDSGRLWLATEGGLTVFDPGATDAREDDAWFTYTTANGLGMPSDEVHAVAIAGNLVWIGGVQRKDAASGEWSGGGVGRLDTKGTLDPRDDEWAPIQTFAGTFREEPDGTSEPGLVSDTVNDLLVTPRGNVWVATSAHWRSAEGADPSLPDEWQRQHGGLSFLDTRGTAAWSDDRWTGFSCELVELTVTCNVRRLAIDPRGRGWAADGGLGLIHFDVELGRLGGAAARITPPSGEGDGFVLDMAFGPTSRPDLADTVWLATRSGGVSVVDHGGTLANKNDDVWNFGNGAPLGTDEGLAADRVQAIEEDEGRMWLGFGPDRGVGRGIQALDVLSLAPQPPLRTLQAPPSNFVTDLAIGRDGTRWAGQVWVATGVRGGATGARLFGAGAAVLDTAGSADTGDDVWRRYTTLSTDNDGALPWTGLTSDNVQAVVLSGDTVWLGSAETQWAAGTRPGEGSYADGGLAAFDGTRWTARHGGAGAATGPGAGGVSSLALGCDGELWAGTGNLWDHQGTGVYVLAADAVPAEPTADHWTRHQYPQLASANTTSLAADCGRRVILAGAMHHVNNADTGGQQGQWSGGGVAAFDVAAARWTRFTVTDGLESFGTGSIKGEVASVWVHSPGRYLAGTFGTHDMSISTLVGTRPYWPAVINESQSGSWSAERFERAGTAASLAVDGVGRIWVATSRGGMVRDSISPDTWPARDDEGGLYVRQGGQWSRLMAQETGLPSNDVSVVRVAADGTVWIGTAGWGLARYDPNAVPFTPTPDLGLATRTPSPTRDPNAPTATRNATPATVRPPYPSPTANATATGRPLDRRVAVLPVVLMHGSGTARPTLPIHIWIPYAAGRR